jgi:hypothetical protein
MPVRAALTTYTYFLRSILTPPMPVRPVPRVCRAMSRGRVALFAGFASSTQARRELTPYRVQLPLGLLLRFRLFPTPPRGDAVAFRFTPGSRFGGGQIFTDWIVCSHDHTWARRPAVARARGGGPSGADSPRSIPRPRFPTPRRDAVATFLYSSFSLRPRGAGRRFAKCGHGVPPWRAQEAEDRAALIPRADSPSSIPHPTAGRRGHFSSFFLFLSARGRGKASRQVWARRLAVARARGGGPSGAGSPS